MTEKLPFNTESLDSLPETVHSFYTQNEDGKFQLSLDGGPAEKVKEFRENNIKANNELKNTQDALTQILGLLQGQQTTQKDPVERQKELQNEVTPNALGDKDVIKQLQDLIKASNDEKAQLKTEKETNDKSAAINSVATELGVPASAQVDVKNRVLAMKHKWEDGQFVFEKLDENGQPMTLKAILDKEIRPSATHLFINQTGTKADPKKLIRTVGQDSNNNAPLSPLERIRAGLELNKNK